MSKPATAKRQANRLSIPPASIAKHVKKRVPKPYLKKAVEQAKPEVERALKKAMKKVGAELNEEMKRKPEPAKKAPAKRGPKTWQPTDTERELIERYIAIGMTQEEVALIMEKSVASLVRHCSHELKAGAVKQNGKIGAKLFERAMTGDTTALIFLAKTRLGFSEKTIHQHQGPDGGPITTETRALTAKEAAERYREKLG